MIENNIIYRCFFDFYLHYFTSLDKKYLTISNNGVIMENDDAYEK